MFLFVFSNFFFVIARVVDVALGERLAQLKWESKQGGCRHRHNAEYELQRLQHEYKDIDGLADILSTPFEIELVSKAETNGLKKELEMKKPCTYVGGL